MKLTTEENVIIQGALQTELHELENLVCPAMQKERPRAYDRFKKKIELIKALIAKLKIS